MTLSEPVREKLDGVPLSAHLATAVDGRPHVAPVWFTLDDEADAVWFLTAGRKLDNLRENPRVALSVESADGRGNVDWHVTMLGTARVVDDREREAWVDRRLAETYAMHAEPEAVDAGTADGTDGAAAEGDADGGYTDEEHAGALVRVDVGSASLSEY